MPKNDFLLRISVTSNCNLTCSYCEKNHLSRTDITSDKELLEIIKSASECGVKRISWTGGEPTVRPGFIDLIKKSKEAGITEQLLTTNGIILSNIVETLKENGITRINISIDSLNPDKFKEITGGNLKPVIKSIDANTKLYTNTKLNCVITKDNFDEIDGFIDFCEKYDGRLTIRFLELVPCGEAFGSNPELFKEIFVPEKDIIEVLKKRGNLTPVENKGNVPKSKYFKIEGLKGTYGINPNESANYVCDREGCKKIRLSPNGYISNCTIKIDKVYKIAGLPYDKKVELMNKIVEDKLNRDFTGYEHRQKHYTFWRFGKKPDGFVEAKL
jgi:GTP 3',8-cyclase